VRAAAAARAHLRARALGQGLRRHAGARPDRGRGHLRRATADGGVKGDTAVGTRDRPAEGVVMDAEEEEDQEEDRLEDSLTVPPVHVRGRAPLYAGRMTGHLSLGGVPRVTSAAGTAAAGALEATIPYAPAAHAHALVLVRGLGLVPGVARGPTRLTRGLVAVAVAHVVADEGVIGVSTLGTVGPGRLHGSATVMYIVYCTRKNIQCITFLVE
jgi:hypothetical protein